MKIAVTGATGFLGRYLVKDLIDNGYEVIVIGRDYAKLAELFNKKNVCSYQTNYSFEELLNIFKGVDIVINLASELMQRNTDPLKVSSFLENLLIFENIALACDKLGISKLIHMSSISCYSNLGVNSEESRSIPSNIYGVSKTFSDIYLDYLRQKSKTQFISLRLARLFGIGDRETVLLTKLTNEAIEGKALRVNGSGSSDIQYIYVRDVVDCIKEFLKRKDLSGLYNVGLPYKISILEIATEINRVFENEKGIVFMEGKDISGTFMPIEQIVNALDWKPKWNLSEALLDMKNIIENKEFKI
ncbi:NAD-dependent epimerase/dehydratase family protein [Myroides odoratimimus]|uniref:NAD-dependent epimerase/dehydratase family protein n=1 Tax=Myroides odoratimimus TaxID=76832 RepID=UPI00370BD4CB